MSGRHPGQRKVTEDDYKAVKRLHGKGKGRNDIAEELGRSGRTISRIAKELGLTFDRKKTEKATAAKVIDAKARRAALALKLLETAERLHDQVFEPTVVFNFGGKENSYNSKTLNIPPHADQLRIMQAIGVAVQNSVALDKYDHATGADEGIAVLDALDTAIRAALEAGK